MNSILINTDEVSQTMIEFYVYIVFWRSLHRLILQHMKQCYKVQNSLNVVLLLVDGSFDADDDDRFDAFW